LFRSSRENLLTNCSSWGSELVHIYVGPEKKKFSVHKKLLCSTSAFFDKAFNSGFQETMTSDISLPEDSSYTFQGFIKWLYHGRLGDLAPDNSKWNLTELVDLYLFGVNKCSNALKNTVMDEIQDYLDEDRGGFGLNLIQIERVYENTVSAEDAPIRKFCCAIIRWFQYLEIDHWDEDELVDFFHNFPDALRDFLKLQNEIWGEVNEPDPRQRNATKAFDMCFFHVHAEGEQCKSKSRHNPGYVRNFHKLHNDGRLTNQ
jgi:hypothetical protein